MKIFQALMLVTGVLCLWPLLWGVAGYLIAKRGSPLSLNPAWAHRRRGAAAIGPLARRVAAARRQTDAGLAVDIKGK